MNKINEIDQIFNVCLDEVLNGRSTIDECLKRYPDYAADLEGLLMTSVDISHAARVEPPAGAKMRIMVALNERMAELSGRKIASKPFWRFGWANAVVSFVVGLSLAGGSMAYAASGAMPGQALYPLKLDLEQALVSVTFSSDAKVQLYAALNDRRVGEIVYLAQSGDSQGIAEVTNHIESNLSAAATAKGLSATQYAAAKAAAPSNSNINATDTTLPAGTNPPMWTGPAAGGTAVPPGTAPAPAIPSTLPSNSSGANVQGSGANGLITITGGSSVLDFNILNHANNQISSLAGISSPSNSRAVQSAIDRALATITNGYDALLTLP